MKIGQKNNFYYIHHLKTQENSQHGINATWHDAYCQLHYGILKIKYIFKHNKWSDPYIEEIND